jgi:hypothetical protein
VLPYFGKFPHLGKFWVQAGKFFSLWGTSPFGEISRWAIFFIFNVETKKLARIFFLEFVLIFKITNLKYIKKRKISFSSLSK